jgi:hypothetical protein
MGTVLLAAVTAAAAYLKTNSFVSGGHGIRGTIHLISLSPEYTAASAYLKQSQYFETTQREPNALKLYK